MGGVDLMDHMIALYPHFAYRTNKWTVRVILHCIMLAGINIWFERGKPMRLFDYSILLTGDIAARIKDRKSFRNSQWRGYANPSRTFAITAVIQWAFPSSQ